MEEEPYESDNSTEFLAEDLHVDVEPSEAEIEARAIEMGMQLPQDSGLLYLARECLTAPLPKYWKPVMNSKGDSYYVDLLKGVAYREHPVDMHYQRLYEREKNISRGTLYERFKLEDVSFKLPHMVLQMQKAMNVLVNLNPISEMQTQRNEEQEEQLNRQNRIVEALEAVESDKAFIYVNSESSSECPEEVLCTSPKETSMQARMAAIRKEQEDRLEARLQQQLTAHSKTLQLEINEMLNLRRMELISDFNCHRMEKQEELEQKEQRLKLSKDEIESDNRKKVERQRNIVAMSCSDEVQSRLEQRLEAIRNEAENRLARTKFELEQLQQQSSRKVEMCQLQEKLKQLYMRFAQVESKRLRVQCRLHYYRRFLSQLCATSGKYNLIERTVKFQNKENLHENCVEYFKQELRKNDALDTYDSLARGYFNKQKKLKLVRPTKQTETGLKREWESLERMRTLIDRECYSEVRELSKTIKLNEVTGNEHLYPQVVTSDEYLIHPLTARTPKLQTPQLYPHSRSKPRLVPKLYRKII